MDPKTDVVVADLMTSGNTIYDFQSDLEGPLGTGDLGPHGGGHFTVGYESSNVDLELN